MFSTAPYPPFLLASTHRPKASSVQCPRPHPPVTNEAFFVPEVSITRLQEESNRHLQPVAMHLTEQSISSGGLVWEQQLSHPFPGVCSRQPKSPSVNLDCLMTFLSF